MRNEVVHAVDRTADDDAFFSTEEDPADVVRHQALVGGDGALGGTLHGTKDFIVVKFGGDGVLQ